jgi:hypothetical protein
VQRLCGVEAPVCSLAMASLVATGFLRLNPDGTYVRLTEDSVHPQPPEVEAPLMRLVRSRRAS